MLAYIFKRLLAIIPMLLGITIISFLVIKLAPGKPVMLQYSLNPKISLETIQRLQAQEGLDRPVIVQYWNWLSNIGRFNFGRSLADGRPVLEKIMERLPVTLTINLLSLLLVLFIAIPLGVHSALKQGTLFDNLSGIAVFFLFSAPSFWLALILMQYFCIDLKWLPVSGLVSLDHEYLNIWGKSLDLARHLLLPVFISSLGGLAGLSRYMRSSMLESLAGPYILAARARGIPEGRVVYTHAFPNAVLPVVTILGLSIPGLLGGSVIFESVFAIPGIGRLFYEAAMMRDLNLIMAEVILVAVLTMLGNLIADISYAYIDPRIRYNK